MKENRFPITSASHRERVERKRREWRENRAERREKKLQREAELSSKETGKKERPTEEMPVVENGGRSDGTLVLVGCC